MKIISRQVGEKIVIDGHITVTVKAMTSRQIVLSIESSHIDPPYREEVISLVTDSDLAPQAMSY